MRELAMNDRIEEYLVYESLSERIATEDNDSTDSPLYDVPDLYTMHLSMESIDTTIDDGDINISEEGIKEYIQNAGNAITQALDNQLDGVRHFITFMSVNEIKLKKYQKALKDFPDDTQSLYFNANPFFRYGSDGKIVSDISDYIDKLNKTNEVIEALLDATNDFTNSRLSEMQSRISNLTKGADSVKDDVIHATGEAIQSFADGLKRLPNTQYAESNKDGTHTYSPTYLGMFCIEVKAPKKIDNTNDKTYAKSIAQYDVSIIKTQTKYKGSNGDRVKFNVSKKELIDLIDTALVLLATFKKFDSVTNRLTERFNSFMGVLNKVAFVVTIPRYFLSAQAKLSYRAMTLVNKNNPKAFVIAKHHVENILHVVEQFMRDK